MTTPQSLRATAALAALGLALVAGCGNRVSSDEIAAVGNGYGPIDAQADNATAAGAGAGSGAVPTDPDAGGLPGTPADPGAGVAPGSTDTPGQADGGPAVVGAPVGKPGTKPGATQPGADRPAGGGAPAAAGPAACARALSPIVLGQTLASSGLVGASIAGLRTGLAVWAKDVNARGGVECHPIQLIQLDDASDPARVSSNWNTLVKDRGAIAVIGAGVPVPIAALRTAAERDKVPVVGGDVTAIDWSQSEYLFPTGGTPLTSYDGGVVEAAKIAMERDGKVKTGLFYCVEASICTGLKNNFAQSTARSKGAEIGPIQAVSLTQPDFTSECQAMKAAGVNVLFYGLDGSAAIRATRSCASLNYFPVIATGAIAVSAQAAADAGLRRNVSFLGTGIVPYPTNDTPGAKAFHEAMKRYAPSSTEDQQALLGWASGLMFEAALSKVSTKARAGDVTTAMVLEGLWQLKNEKLQGLSPGATFTKGLPAKRIDCYYPLRLDDKGFTGPLGSKAVCFNGNTAQAPAVPKSTTDSGTLSSALTATHLTSRHLRGRRRGRR